MAVAIDILDMVRCGELRPGSPLPNEADLCARFTASRTRVREAVKFLQGRGFLRVEHGRGTWVEPVEHWDLMDPELWLTALTTGNRSALIRDLVDIRRMLELRIVQLATHNRTPEQLVQLEQDFSEMQANLSEDDQVAFNKTSRHFHDQLAIASGNVLLLKLSRSLHQALELTKQSSGGSTDVLRLSLRGHEAILKAMQNGDSEEAAKAMLQHLVDFEKTVRKPSDERLSNVI